MEYLKNIFLKFNKTYVLFWCFQAMDKIKEKLQWSECYVTNKISWKILSDGKFTMNQVEIVKLDKTSSVLVLLGEFGSEVKAMENIKEKLRWWQRYQMGDHELPRGDILGGWTFVYSVHTGLCSSL